MKKKDNKKKKRKEKQSNRENLKNNFFSCEIEGVDDFSLTTLLEFSKMCKVS